ncbi:hypothetical protein N0V93_005067 [Gnomoniopsis smithogilvyi]|uniref:Synaptobrevin n=1 Tax=Gnomoniopsis smithogilvyi TaxID=1191159 RepID=A0A9W8YUV9_9PEZI|nr:hypothetical protein N0V93_005067 [Gnomoniopsis smithogilvyi]
MRPQTQPMNPIADLDRLLSRLQQSILRADAERERRLRDSEYERQKLAFNIDYARTLLTRMEQDAFGIKVLTRKQETQADLNRKRELLDTLTYRLKEVEELSAHSVDDEDTSSEGDDYLNEIIMTPSDSIDSRSTDIPTQGTGEDDEANNDQEERLQDTRSPGRGGSGQIVETLDDFLSEKPDVVTTQTLRPRGKQSAPSDPEKQAQFIDTAQTTGASRSLLFGEHAKDVSDVANSEAILDHQRKEQEIVTEDLLRMAGQLKLSSQKFGEALQEDTEILNRAGEGLSKNELSLEAAARRMGAITKMTEGKGWYGRIMLYAWIYGLMVLLVLLVFVLPKLRF